MGYLNESFSRIERVMNMLKMCDQQQDTLRTGYYLGAKVFLGGACEWAGMDDERWNAMFSGCRDDLEAFDAKVRQDALAVLEKMQ